MKPGLQLVMDHVDSFFAGRVEDYPRQVTADYRHHYLADDLGEGPDSVIRWRNILFTIYKDWRVDVSDAHDHGDEVIIRLNFVGRNPAEANVPATCESSAVLHYSIREGKLSGCHSLHPAFEEVDDAVLKRTADAQRELR